MKRYPLGDELDAWCQGRNWLVRAPVLVFFGYVLFRHLADPDYLSVLQGLNLGVHELGHLLFVYFGRFLSVFGGTFWELAAPLLGMWNFYRQRDFFAILACFGWLSTALFDVGRYAADARALAIPLVAPFGGGEDGVGHDWQFMLGQAGLLPYDQLIGGAFRVAGVVAMLVCLVGGAFLLWRMAGSAQDRFR
ncbi:MAG: hypothetical protein HQL20_03120 [Candidatus Omnitrophica bacterium]|nr:hypothetical protein [Candidatus Omnitrophota bacterium]